MTLLFLCFLTFIAFLFRAFTVWSDIFLLLCSVTDSSSIRSYIRKHIEKNLKLKRIIEVF
ncbi:hypothetical protein JCM6292_3362 [Bacteroides pyogenes JCM 6292]|uniref:Uncharacterized protein n=1 Tax=Bacteroides pyogenes JCM 6292 TaxID=1235809 RepID=W4PAN7_9BACE|nr:hypothetical protein JCM6292_3362 [Bacteroides pyogenes JCM 6292]